MLGLLRRKSPLWLGLDVLSVLAFVVIGRAAHTKGEALAGIASTAWPFLVGLGGGWLAARAWRRPTALYRAGLPALIGAAGLGMVLRVLAGQGTALAFIFVTLGFLGLLMLGWRFCYGVFRAVRAVRTITAIKDVLWGARAG